MHSRNSKQNLINLIKEIARELNIPEFAVVYISMQINMMDEKKLARLIEIARSHICG